MLIASSIALIRRYARYRSELACISRLDERTLRDIGLRHSNFSFLAGPGLSRIGATPTDCAGAAVVVAVADPVPVAAPPLAGAASALVPKIALMIFPKILIVCSL